MHQIVSFIRVSTGKQGKSSLGIEVQREAIAQFAAAEGREVLDEFEEVETGREATRLDRNRLPSAAVADKLFSSCTIYATLIAFPARRRLHAPDLVRLQLARLFAWNGQMGPIK